MDLGHHAEILTDKFMPEIANEFSASELGVPLWFSLDLKDDQVKAINIDLKKIKAEPLL